MKVLDLIEALMSCDKDAEVHFAYNYGDHGRTTVAPEVRCVDEAYVKYSEYHRMPTVVENDGTPVVVLSDSPVS
jgi:hypothetical protein